MDEVGAIQVGGGDLLRAVTARDTGAFKDDLGFGCGCRDWRRNGGTGATAGDESE
jgi:hypothetical protein